MNITTPRLDTAHPPCPPPTAPHTIEIPADASRLALADRLSLRIGLWLLLRAQRAKQQPTGIRPDHGQERLRPGEHPLTIHEAITLAGYELQRQLR